MQGRVFSIYNGLATASLPIAFFLGGPDWQQQSDEAYGWNAFASEEVEIHQIPGDHLSMMNEPNIQVLGDKLRRCLESSGVSIPC